MATNSQPKREYSKEELWALFKKLPQPLQDAVFAPETADRVFNICDRYHIQELSRLAYFVGLVLMGVIMPEEFENILIKEMRLRSDVAKGVAAEVNRFIFYPVRIQLADIHKVKVEGPTATEEILMGKNSNPSPPSPSSIKTVPQKPSSNNRGGKTRIEEIKQPSNAKDVYREPIEEE